MQITVKDPHESLAAEISSLQFFAQHKVGCAWYSMPHALGEALPACDCGLHQTIARIDELLQKIMGPAPSLTPEPEKVTHGK